MLTEEVKRLTEELKAAKEVMLLLQEPESKTVAVVAVLQETKTIVVSENLQNYPVLEKKEKALGPRSNK